MPIKEWSVEIRREKLSSTLMSDLVKIFLVCLALVGCRDKGPCQKCLELEVEPFVFFESLIGKWEGYAITTPIGKVSYDLQFKMLGKHTLKGTSYTNGMAIHTWIFKSDTQGQIVLDFHSTFGDSWAKGLCAAQVDQKKGYLFANGHPSHLKVWVNPLVKDEIQFRIFLNDKPHVSIVVSRDGI